MFTVYSFINWQSPPPSRPLTVGQEAMNRKKNLTWHKPATLRKLKAAPNSFRLFIL